MDSHLIEIRGDVPRDRVDVLDAVAQATSGASRMSVLRAVLAEWVDRKCHEASLIQRVRRGNGSAPEAQRNRSGGRPE